jgi:hypothetical protein
VIVQKDIQVRYVPYPCASQWTVAATAVAYKVNVCAKVVGVVMHVMKKNAQQMQQETNVTAMACAHKTVVNAQKVGVAKVVPTWKR